MTYTERLHAAVCDSDSTLCVGLDPNLDLIPDDIRERYASPDEQVLAFCKSVIEITYPYCAAYKPNLAFFEALGDSAFEILRKVIDVIPDNRIVIADAKRGDISSTAEHYKIAFFDRLKVDALTVNPLMGFESLEAYMSDPDIGLYVLTLTSNPGASDFFKKPFDGFESLAEYIATGLSERMNEDTAHLGMVVGATQASYIAPVLQAHRSASLLIPGIGAQGGSLDELTRVLEGHEGIPLINSSRAIIYAGQGSPDWKKMIEESARKTKHALSLITSGYV